MKKTLLVDMSPVYYRWIFSTTAASSKQLKLKKNEDGVYDLDEYQDIYIFKVLDYLTKFKNRFGVDEIVLAMDHGPYWRKEIWSGYKYGRHKNDKSGIDWSKAKKLQRKMTDILKNYSSFKVIDIPRVEGDDSLFVLSEELSKRGHEVIAKSLDHDIIYILEHENVSYWQTKHNAPSKSCGFVEYNGDEIKNLKYEHCVFGDKGDYLLPITAFTEFSDEFKKLYPDMTPLQAYPRRHEIDVAFEKKYGVSAYKHPRFGAASFHKKMEKEGFTLQDFLKKDPIHIKNFALNKQLGLPSGIPQEIRDLIIHEYDNTNTTRDEAKLIEFFTEYGIFELIGKLGFL